MTFKSFITSFLITFIIVFVVNAIIVYLWNLIFHGASVFEWETSLQFAIIFGVILPLYQAWVPKQKKSEATGSV